VGVDVEATDGPGSTTEIAEHFFAPPEIAELRLISARQRRERFFQYWTLKESYIKARGAGLTLPLDQFWFSLLPGRPIEIRFARGFDDDPGRWRFALRRPSPRHQLAIALGGASDRPVTSIIDANWLCDLWASVYGDSRDPDGDEVILTKSQAESGVPSDVEKEFPV
jgi:4'-phosphopantetheinyl transferase